jgi:hypothetical protein
MPDIFTASTTSTPSVDLSLSTNRLELLGECYPENSLPFFAPIISALKDHFSASRPERFEAYFHLQYVNSASTKGLQNIISVLNDAGAAGTAVHVHWAYDPEDDALEELGVELVGDFAHVVLHRQPTPGGSADSGG